MKDALPLHPRIAELIGAGEANGTAQSVFRLSTVNNLVTLINLFTEIRPKRTLEVGLGDGGSAIIFTASHRQAGSPPMAQHTAVDPFETTGWNDSALVALDNAGLRGYLVFRPGFSSIVLPSLMREGARFELIFIDGSHLFDDVFVDFYFSSRLLTDDGVVAFDDSTNAHVRKVLRFIRTNCGCLLPVDLSPYRADKGTGLRYRTAKALGRTQLTAFRKIGPWVREWNVGLKKF